MLEIFLSWSGPRSRETARALREWLPRVLHYARPWMSDQDIPIGAQWFREIGARLQEFEVGVLCVTPENHEAPWLLFEAGALSKALPETQVVPLLLGLSPNELSGPLAQFQATTLRREDLYRLLVTLNQRLGEERVPTEVLRDAFDKSWSWLRDRIEKVAALGLSGEHTNLSSVLRAFSKYGLPEPILGGQANFESGFESHRIYSTLEEITQERLYVFGRKNRKLFDKDHRSFFETISRRLGAGLDLRLLFLDPNSPEHVLRAAHRDSSFQRELSMSLEGARKMLREANIEIGRHCKSYSVYRPLHLIVVDDSVLYSPIRTDKEGRALPLTDSPFTLVHARSAIGKELVETFLGVWDSAQPMC